jgi:GAF domain-containing protein
VDCVSENKEHLKAIQDAVGFDTKSMIAHPIIVQSKIYGVLELLNRIGEDQFSESDVELTNYLCEYLGKTIEIRLMMAGLYKKAKQHKKAA